MSSYGFERSGWTVLSRPFKVMWDAWESTTTALQRCGWEFAVERDQMRREYRLLMQNRQMRLTGITTYEVIEDYQACDPAYPDARLPDFHLTGLFSEVYEQRSAPPTFYAVDMEPQYTMEKVALHELGVFARQGQAAAAEEVLVEKADMSVIEHLEAIKHLQSGKQKELREKARKAGPTESLVEQPARNVIVQLVNYR